MRPLSFLAGLVGLFMAVAATAQTPAAVTGVPPPPPPLSPENAWQLDLSTGGRVTIQLRPDVAPAHVERIRTLTRQGFYDGLIFHRVIEGFMAQGGDPTGTGAGGSDLPDLPAEIHGLPHMRGAVAMARAEEMNSANSQFYIMFVPRLSMDRDYTVFGRVVTGMNFVDAIERGEPPLAPTRIVRASIGSDNVPPMTAEQLRAAGQASAVVAPTAPSVTPTPVSNFTLTTAEPAEATESTEATASAEASDVTEDFDPAEATEPTEATEPAEAREPAEATGSVEATEPAEAAEPAEPSAEATPQ